MTAPNVQATADFLNTTIAGIQNQLVLDNLADISARVTFSVNSSGQLTATLGGTAPSWTFYGGMVDGGYIVVNGVHDGTTNDSAVIQSALNAASTYGAGEVWILSGQNYGIGTTLSIPSNVALKIPYGATLTALSGLSGPMIQNKNASDSNIRIFGFGTINGANHGQSCIKFTRVSKSLVEYVTINNAALYGIEWIIGDYNTIQHCNVDNPNTIGIYCRQQTNYVKILDNVVTNPGVVTGGGGIWVQAGTGTPAVEGIEISGNIVDFTGTTVTGNTLAIVTDSGGSLANSSPRGKVTRNSIIGPTTVTGGTFWGISASQPGGVIAENTIRVNLFYGIEVLSAGMIVMGNTIDGVVGTSSHAISIVGSNGPNECQVIGNRIANCDVNGQGLYIGAGDRHVIDGNIFVDAGKQYILLNGSTGKHSTLSNNKFIIKGLSVNADAMYLSGADGCLIIGNDVLPDPSGSSTHGLEGVYANVIDSVRILNNHFDGSTPASAGATAAAGAAIFLPNAVAGLTNSVVMGNDAAHYTANFCNGATSTSGGNHYLFNRFTDCTSGLTNRTDDYVIGLPSQDATNPLTLGIGALSTLKGTVLGANRLQTAEGAASAAANNLVLGTDGNVFHITGATQVNLIANTNWQGAGEVTLIFDSNPVVKHNQAASGANKPILLSGSVDLSTAANTRLKLIYDSTNSVWMEVARTLA